MRDIAAPTAEQSPSYSAKHIHTRPTGQDVTMYPRGSAVSPYEAPRVLRSPPRPPIGPKCINSEVDRRKDPVGFEATSLTDLSNRERSTTLLEPEDAARPLFSGTGAGSVFDGPKGGDGSPGATETAAQRKSSPGGSTHESACGPASIDRRKLPPKRYV